MGKFINKIVENNILFASVLIVLAIILIVLIVLIVKSIRDNKKINVYEEDLEDEDFKKVKNVKKEDIIETPDIEEEDVYSDKHELKKYNYRKIEKNFDSDELEQRYYEEKQKEIESAKKAETDSELEKIISKMEEESKLKPEEVVANFEKEQEAQSIISYKELVKAVKNKDENYEDELESRPLDTVSNLMDDLEKNQYEEDNYQNEYSDEFSDRKFRNTDVISPVFGIVESSKKSNYDTPKRVELKKEDDIQKTIDLSSADLSDLDFMLKDNKETSNNNESLTALDEIYKQMAGDLKVDDESENTDSKQLNQNEEFLKSLKEFRNKL